MKYSRFLVFDFFGSLGWAAAWLLAGRFFGDLAKRSAALFHVLSHYAVLLIVLMIAAILLYRWIKQLRFLAELRGLRLEPAQLLAMFEDAKREALAQPFIVDLRHPLDVLTDPQMLPGAVRIGPTELKQRRAEIPRDRDVVLYCTCPSEETSAKVAMDLRRIGILRVRPLRGGLQGWKDAGYPLEDVVMV
jgi:rhodanese-related sulfurtransferase